MGLSPTKKISSPRIARMLHKLGLTVTQFQNWCGFRTTQWVRENPKWTERQFFELLSENHERIAALDTEPMAIEVRV